LRANANQTNGGNMALVGEYVILGENSVISASGSRSQQGLIIDSVESLDAPDFSDISLSFLDLGEFVTSKCEMKTSPEKNSFLVENMGLVTLSLGVDQTEGGLSNNSTADPGDNLRLAMPNLYSNIFCL
jgi:hypothetical protein